MNLKLSVNSLCLAIGLLLAQSPLLAQSLTNTSWVIDSTLSLHFTADSVHWLHKGIKKPMGLYHFKNDTLIASPTLLSYFYPKMKQNKVQAAFLRNGARLQLKAFNQSLPMVTMPRKGEGIPLDWAFQDLEKDKTPGCSLYEALRLVSNRIPAPVVIGVIDTGIDTTLSQFNGQIWRNTREIAGNNIDDDRNGYIDDTFGWFWLFSRQTGYLLHDQAEPTRIVANYPPQSTLYQQARPIFDKEYQTYQQFKRVLTDSLSFAQTLSEFSTKITQGPLSINQLIDLPIDSNDFHRAAKAFVIAAYRPTSKTWDEFTQRLATNYRRYRHILGDNWEYTYNPDFKTPQPLTGTGTWPVGPDRELLEHGTAVGGILTAPLDQQQSPLRLMNLGAAPLSGDERDSILAAAIRYGVDQGAKVINISIAKTLSPQRALIDAALLYAEHHDVLLINCAGNTSTNTDSIPYYPVGQIESGRMLTNFLEVGNSTVNWNQNLAYYSSNYGAKSVDLFAPGTQLWTCLPGGQFSYLSGTSFSAPLVARVAGLLRSYFPNLRADQVIDILLRSVRKPSFLVIKPGTTKKVPFHQLCRSGGILDAKAAFKLALTYSPK